jgi:ABC-type antimicrobial peptide transport system permease subunit
MEKLAPFQFAQSAAIEGKSGWALLFAELSPPKADPLGDDAEIPVIPAVVDMNTATYALQLGIGGRVIYGNGSGARFAVEIVGMLETSILQGSLLIDEAQFIRSFPDAGGYSFFLLDGATPEVTAPVAATMTRMFGDRGLELRPAAERLNEFNAVQNTYLSIFSTLGGLGLFLGTLGLGIVVARNVLERRGQLGVMQAMGFTKRQLAKLVLAEHWFLHLAGVLLGFGAALVAVIPKLGGSGGLPWPLLLGVNAAVLLGGLVFCAVAARLVVRGPLYDAIRSE